jgi:hypothetical protein
VGRTSSTVEFGSGYGVVVFSGRLSSRGIETLGSLIGFDRLRGPPAPNNPTETLYSPWSDLSLFFFLALNVSVLPTFYDPRVYGRPNAFSRKTRRPFVFSNTALFLSLSLLSLSSLSLSLSLGPPLYTIATNNKLINQSQAFVRQSIHGKNVLHCKFVSPPSSSFPPFFTLPSFSSLLLSSLPLPLLFS